MSREDWMAATGALLVFISKIVIAVAVLRLMGVQI